MKNTNIAPKQLVPVEIRIECYQKAIQLITDGKYISKMDDYATCILLPCILWDLSYFCDDAPNGETWKFYHVEDMFPEWTYDVISQITRAQLSLRNEYRLKHLNLAIWEARRLLENVQLNP